MKRVWGATTRQSTKRRKVEEDDDGDDGSGGGIQIPIAFPTMNAKANNIYSHMNHVYFNDDITSDTAFALNAELRNTDLRMRMLSLTQDIAPPPLVLHLTTNGGCIHSAFTIIDTLATLKVPVHTVVEGFVASAGTLISLAGEKRFIGANAYMLIHELRSGVWGKMSSMEEEYENLRKIMKHIVDYYVKHTDLTKSALKNILNKDLVWNAKECIDKGIVDAVYGAE